ncbi:hypothetical protein [Mesorhizobium australafricanum]|uniref:Uncharacterized protein n=1 Tax=Mesorhizobium australafricanum TaxID=3072311 RepID=A0ABU4X5E3_9HYPH|nr:hypothetical protein [Mesorhizobium sp. VK3E]MDX8443545.1 hypothetical protein [Mesorhizobium sp. VK3E]
MAESKQERDERLQAEKEFRIQFLVKENGITEAQARDLVEMIGIDANSLLREALEPRGFRRQHSFGGSVGFSVKW